MGCICMVSSKGRVCLLKGPAVHYAADTGVVLILRESQWKFVTKIW